MGRDALPEKVQTLATEHLQSGADIDVLLLLYRHSDHDWAALRVSQELRLHADQAQAIMDRLADSGLLRAEGRRYTYAPRTAELAQAVDAVAGLHPSYRPALMRLIFSGRAGARPADQ